MTEGLNKLGSDTQDGYFNLSGSKIIASDTVGGAAKTYNIHKGQSESIAAKAKATISNPHDVHDVRQADGTAYSLVAEDVKMVADGVEYALNNVLDSVEDAAEAVGKFINNLADEGTKWFTEGGPQTAFAAWLSQNIGSILSGQMDGGQAVIGLARYMAASFLPGYVVTTQLDAQRAIATILHNNFGVGEGDPIGADGKLIADNHATQYAASMTKGLEAMVATFVTSGFNTQQALNAGASTMAGMITAKYLELEYNFTPRAAGDVSIAIMTAAQALLSGNFNGNWVQLGVQIGIAVAASELTGVLAGSVIGEALSSALPPVFGVDPTTIVISFIVSFIVGKLLGGLFGSGKHYDAGEFPSPEALYNSIYQVQTITIDGQQVPALVAVNPQGSTILVAGTNIGYILGGAGADVEVGTDAVQTIVGNAGADYLEARGGNDNLLGGDGSDHLNGGDGNDVLQGDAGDDIILAEAGNDTALGGAGSDFMHLGSGDDIAAAGDGNDYVLAGGGDDAVSAGAGDDSVDGGYGDDSIQGDEGSDLILANLGNDYVEGGDGSDTVFGDVGNDQLHGGNGNDFIDGGAGIDMLYGDAGRDIIIGDAGDDFADGGIGADNILGGDGNDVLLGGMDDDYIAGDAGDDSISGGFGNDILVGGLGVNTLEGGEGNDIYVIGANMAEHTNAIIDDGLATDADTILLSWVTDAPANLTLLKEGDDLVISHGSRVLTTVKGQFTAGKSVERIELAGGNYINLAAVNYDATSHLGSFAVEAGTMAAAGALAVRVNEVQDNLLSKGSYWNDTFLNKLSQLAYDEQLSDQTVYTYYDGTEFETYKRSQGKFGGKYTIYKLLQPGSIGGTEFTRLEYAIQDAEDQAAAAPFGDDKTTLSGPYESLINGATVVYSNVAGKNVQDIVINGNVVSTKVAGESTQYAAGASVYGATYAQRLSSGTSFISDVAVKKMGGDLLVGAYWNETIDGKSGDDILIGNEGNDNIIGGDGNDWGFGGTGDDTLSGGNGDDVLFGGDGNDSISGGAHDDAVLGAAGNDTISGDAGNDWLDAGTGNDSVSAGDGDDIIIGGDGNDTLRGDAGDDIIHGDNGNDVLYGGEGNDTLIGGFGSDSLYGGGGNDVLNGDGGAVLLDGGDGQDMVVFTGVNGEVVANLETSVFGGNGVNGLVIRNFEHVTGSSYNDLIYSGRIANTIDGGEGIDIVSYQYSNAAVTVNLATNANTGGDAQGDVLSNVEYVVGSDFSDMVYGNLANNIIDGGAGDDRLDGGAGTDILTGGAGADQFVLNYGISTAPTVTDFVQGSDKIDLSHFVYAKALSDLVITQVGANTTIRVSRMGSNAITLEGVTSSTLDGNDFIFNSSPNYALGATGAADIFKISASEISLTRITGFNYAQGDRLEITNYDALIDDKSDIRIIQVGSDAALIFPAMGGNYAVVELVGVTASSITNSYFLSNAINYGLGIDPAYGYGDDNIAGTMGNDTILGGRGNDTILGGTGNDKLYGEDGNDTIDGGYGNDYIDGGLGNNFLSGGSGNDTLTGNVGSDKPNIGSDTIYGGTGNDTIYGMNGDDTLYGEDGNDYIEGGYGHDLLIGGAGNDTILGNYWWDTIYGGTGNDVIYGGDDENTVYGEDGDDYIDGQHNSDLLVGGSGNDTILGNTWYDTIYGGAGNDVIYGESHDDTLYGEDGNDSLDGGDGIDQLYGGAGDDSLNGGSGNDVMYGGAGADTLDGGSGDDYMVGGAGADVLKDNSGLGYAYYYASLEAVSINLATGINTGGDAEGDTYVGIRDVYGSIYNDLIVGDANANHLSGSAGDDTIIGGAGADTLDGGAGNDFFDGGAGADRFYGGGGIDTINYKNSSAAVNINLALSTFYGGDAEGDYLAGSGIGNAIGSDLNDTIVGAGITTILRGGAGNDLITSLSAGNSVYGDEGNDTVYGSSGNETMDGGAGADRFYGGGGIDTINYKNSSAAVNINLALSTFYGGDAEGDYLAGSGIGNAIGSDLNDTIVGAGITTILRGGAGNDLITSLSAGNSVYGDEGNDTLDGGSGAQTILGGLGDDLMYVDNIGDTIVENAGEGIDTIYASIAYTLGANVENLTLSSNAAINGYGNSLDNVIDSRYNTAANAVYGYGGNDTFISNVGDTMIGGMGNDIYYIDNSSEVVVEGAHEGADSVVSTIAYALGSNVENLTLTGTASLNGTGNELDNLMVGNAGNNSLVGGMGNDTLDGGLGNDTMVGGSGNDSYVVNVAADVVTENAGEGIDTVTSAITYTLGTNIEHLILSGVAVIHATGNALDNALTGNAANNTLDGRAGNDTMAGGAGDDLYLVDSVGDVVAENVNEGTDTITSSVTYSLGANIEKLTLSGTAAINATGNALNNTLTGNAADNILDGGSGNDTLVGGLGNDTYMVDVTSDVVAEAATAGTDIVISSATYTLGANIENLILTGSLAINGTGNTGSNVITGNSANNILSGGAGNDTMIGGGGDDGYVVDAIGDVITENANEGMDSVTSTVTYALGANIENLTLSGYSPINGTGNALNNMLTGNASNNILDGGVGNDTLTGGAGNDTMIGGSGDDNYTVDAVGDVVTENANEGTDNVTSTVTYTLGANIEHLTLGGYSAVNGAGNALNNTLIGNAANNILDGGAGNDTLRGGAGNDTYVVDAVGDVVVENLNEGADTVTSYINYVLGANLEHLTLLGAANITATGNALNNRLIGNAGDNTLDGGLGVDTMLGGAGNDTYIFDVTGENITENANEGIDTVMSSVNHGLGANLENLTLTGVAALSGTGNALNNVIVGNIADNTIDGGVGNDTMSGGAGNDSYIVDAVGDVVIEAANEGTDKVTSAVSYTLGANIENLTLSGTAVINGTGNVLNNLINGNASTNILDGGLGNDTLSGGNGNDTYIVDAAGDVVIENYGQGADTVISSVTYTLAGNLEYLTLSGTAAINATGNTLDNKLTGNSGNNVLDGNTGNDTMLGWAGNDSYIVNAVGDVVTENANEGTDTVISSVTYTLANNVENLTLSGTLAINGTGNMLNNMLIGNDANNILNGGLGNDTLFGGNGTDSLTGGADSDVFIVSNTAMATTVTDFVQGVDKIDLTGFTLVTSLTNLTLQQSGLNALVTIPRSGGNLIVTLMNVTAASLGANDFIINTGVSSAPTDGHDTLIGTPSNDSINGLAGNDTISGLAGNDTLDGGLGNDSILGGDGDDTIIGGAGADSVDGGAGMDTISYAASAAGVNVDLSTNTHSGGDANGDSISNVEHVTGSNFNDQLTGSASANTLWAGAGEDLIFGAAGADRLVGGLGNDTLLGGNDNDVLIGGPGSDYIDGGAGLDTVSYEAAATWVSADLGANSYSNGDGAGDTVVNVENIAGSYYNDFLYGDAGVNRLDGRVGNDQITGNGGADILTGGEGAELFIYKAISDSGIGANNRDIIIDFSQAQGDRIDLSPFAGTFRFLGAGAFTGAAAPEARFFDDGTNTIVQVDANGDQATDFEIQINGHVALLSGDFVL